MFIETALNEIEQNEQYQEIEKQIVIAEKQLLKIAPDNVKKLYHDIDFLCCRQREIAKKILINYG